MNQALHIFTKDARRFWPEVVLSLALLAAFAYVAPLAALGPDPRFGTNVLYSLLQPILYVLIPISWWVLVPRVVHEENLVGDRQFWITRPYRWPSLLGAKVLFLVVFVLAPIGLMQAFILFSTGFHLVALLPGLLFSVALLGTMVLLPLFALSTVTASFAKLAVAILGIVLALVLFGALMASQASNIGFALHPEWIYSALSLVGSATIVLLQYARRRTLLARMVLLASLVLLIVLPVFFGSTLTPLYFPSVSAARPAPVTIAFDPDPRRRATGVALPANEKYVSLSLPIIVSGVAPNSLSVIESGKVTLTSSDGRTYNGPWRSDRTFYRPNDQGSLRYLTLLVPTTFLDQVKSSTVTAHITLGVSQLTAQSTLNVPFPSGTTEVPGVGICTGSGNSQLEDPSRYSVACTFALRSPAYTEATARWSDYPCNRPQPPVDQLVPGDANFGSYDSDPSDFGLSPVIRQHIGFSNGTVPLPNNANRPRYLCPGTPLTFTRYALDHRASIELTAPNLNLADYVPKPADYRYQNLQSSGPTD